jgi:hypothetical protein
MLLFIQECTSNRILEILCNLSIFTYTLLWVLNFLGKTAELLLDQWTARSSLTLSSGINPSAPFLKLDKYFFYHLEITSFSANKNSKPAIL